MTTKKGLLNLSGNDTAHWYILEIAETAKEKEELQKVLTAIYLAEKNYNLFPASNNVTCRERLRPIERALLFYQVNAQRVAYGMSILYLCAIRHHDLMKDVDRKTGEYNYVNDGLDVNLEIRNTQLSLKGTNYPDLDAIIDPVAPGTRGWWK